MFGSGVAVGARVGVATAVGVTVGSTAPDKTWHDKPPTNSKTTMRARKR
jgi:hypothetical protein